MQENCQKYSFENYALSPSSCNTQPVKIVKHHESFKNRFTEYVKRVVSGFTVNLFLATEFTPINNVTVEFNTEVVNNIKRIHQIGEEQFQTFWKELC